MKNKYYTRKQLCKETGCMPFLVSYLLSIGRLKIANQQSKRGVPNLYLYENIEIIKDYLRGRHEGE